MANPIQQNVRQRKVIYLALIVVLFTVSLLHRRLVVEKQAEELQLREVARGEVELTGSFVRLSLTGSRGLATTILWATAIERQARHEWNELELLVGSISKLQPYFITPWVFQGWNLAFNVAVECDRPRDKYYYISRGLEFLAEGERRNQGAAEDAPTSSGWSQFPGHPEMRYYMGFYYQLKIGQSDEKNTMRCLFDLSCIDPLERRKENFVKTEGGPSAPKETIDLQELEKFSDRYPRLVRRLRDQLGYDTPRQIVKFLEDNKDVPTRFKSTVAAGQKQSDLEEPRKQFPVLPPAPLRQTGRWPDPKSYQLSPEALDVFLVCRTWYQYAQEPLPPPNPNPGVTEAERDYDRKLDQIRKEQHVNFRNARNMAIEIFRSYPSRAQSFIAENLESEGWFDIDGWVVKDWFGEEREVRVGKDAKYHAAPAWEKAWKWYLEYGTRTGLYISPADTAELNRKAEPLRVAMNIAPTAYVPGVLREDMREKYRDSLFAHQKLVASGQSRSMTNYDGHLAQTYAEKDDQTVLFRKLLYHATRFNRTDQQQALPLYEQAWPLWVEIALRYPPFAQNGMVQEDVYEALLKYLRLSQLQRPEMFRSAMLCMAQLAVWPHPNWEALGWIDTNQRSRIVSVRVARGPLEMVAYYDGPEAEATRVWWQGLTGAAIQIGQTGFAPPVLLPEYALVGAVRQRQILPPTDWRYLIDSQTTDTVRMRFGLIPRPVGPPTQPDGRPPLPRQEAAPK